jgi:hypothetical protein
MPLGSLMTRSGSLSAYRRCERGMAFLASACGLQMEEELPVDQAFRFLHTARDADSSLGMNDHRRRFTCDNAQARSPKGTWGLCIVQGPWHLSFAIQFLRRRRWRTQSIAPLFADPQCLCIQGTRLLFRYSASQVRFRDEQGICRVPRQTLQTSRPTYPSLSQ